MTDQPSTTAALASEPIAASILTCSFRGDLECTRTLCESLDRFVGDVDQYMYVPTADLPLFAELRSPKRILRSQDKDLLPVWFRKLPMPPNPWRRWLRLPSRNVYLTPYSLPVRGWIAQQIMKIEAAARSETEIVMHVDSDVFFVRPTTTANFLDGRGRVRFFRTPSSVDQLSHRLWQEAGNVLLGLPAGTRYNADYVGQLVIWRRSVVRRMIAHIESRTGQNWRIALARTLHFSEYTLYGLFVEHVLGFDAAGHAPEEFSLCLTRWEDGFADAADKTNFISQLKPGHVAGLIQSTLPVSAVERHEVYKRMAAFARNVDSSGSSRGASA